MLAAKSVAAQIRRGNAVIVVHGIDYDGNGVYDDGLQRSDLGNKRPGEATDPAPSGTVARAAQTTGTASSANSGAATVYSASLNVDVSMSGPGGMICCYATPAGSAANTSLAERRTVHVEAPIARLRQVASGGEASRTPTHMS